MSSQPTVETSPAPGPETTAQRFRRLADLWQRETWHFSSATRMAEHPAYREIISMGPAVVPLLLAELARQPDHWFAALQTITGANPVDPADRGHVDRMAAAWLAWGRANGYRW
jgi:hypothetical protein